jgi:hypothetical protein
MSGMDTPWPINEILQKLIEATDHLLNDHNCDHHGYEQYQQAANAGRQILSSDKEREELRRYCELQAMKSDTGGFS